MHLHPTSFRWTTTALAVLLTVSFVHTLFPYEGIRRLKISPKECFSPKYENTTGICMFNLECQERQGIVIGACVDRFLFGACCYVPNYTPPSDENDASTFPVPTTTPTTTIPNQRTTKEPEVLVQLPLNSGIRVTSPESLGVTTTAAGLTPLFEDAPLRPVRFPVRPSVGSTVPTTESPPLYRLPEKNAGGEALVPLHHPHDPLPIGDVTTVSSTRVIGTVLPVTLETFSSVSAPLSYSPSGNHHDLHHSHGQSIVSLESAPLNTKNNIYLTNPNIINNNNNNNNNNKPSSSNIEIFTEDPPKLSTFMYVDLSGTKDSNLHRYNYSAVSSDFLAVTTERTPSETEATIIGERTTTILPSSLLNENLNSGGSGGGGGNTENVWSVMLQLASQIKDTTESDVKFDSDELYTSLSGGDKPAHDKSTTSSSSSSSSQSHDSASDSNESKFEEGNLSDIWKITTTSSVTGGASLSVEEDDERDEETTFHSLLKEKENTESVVSSLPTSKPWAASTYQVHTFKYPEESTTAPVSRSTESIITTEGPIVGLTTWFGIDSQKLRNPTTEQPFVTTFYPNLITAKRTTPTAPTSQVTMAETTSRTTEATTEVTTTTATTTTTTTTTPATTTTSTTTTLRPRPTTTTTTTTEKRVPVRSTSEKPYTLPPRKKPVPGTVTDLAPPSPTKKVTVAPLTSIIMANKPSKKPVGPKPSMKDKEPETSFLQEDLEDNLDDFVNQVVQGLAGSLDSLDLDDVILTGSSPRPVNLPSTLHPFSVLSDPLFPPFPMVGKVPLTKPSKTGLGKPGVSKPALNGVKTQSPQKKVTPTTTTTTTTARPLDFRRDCGVRPMVKQGRIVGGTPAKFGRWPWQALVREATWLGLFSKNKCGGVLIAPKYVLTAAHCQPGFLATLTVVLGDFDISSETEVAGARAITKNVKRVIVHRDYNAQTFENDIAILELESPIDYQQHIVPICLPNEADDFMGRQAYVTGWGRLRYGGGVPQQLHEVDVPIINNTECQQMFLKSNHVKAIRDSFICAGYAQGLKDSCEGDSGGPLALQRPNGQWVLAGTVSHGIKCAYPNLPGVYMRMTFYKPWIKRVTGVN